MGAALERAEKRLKAILGGSIGNVVIEVKWEDPTDANAAADSNSYAFKVQSVAIARDKLINRAEADSEPPAEVLVYESLAGTSIPFFWDSGTQRQATQIIIPSSLNQHLQFQAHGGGSDGFARFRPPHPGLKWQFWKKEPLAGHQLFELIVLHEALHCLGFTTQGDAETLPSSLFIWDLMRVPESSVPVSATNFATISRELRPTVEASWITRLNTAAGAYKASRGKRMGGDNFQASHWRSMSRLDPMVPIGVMDPGASSAALYEANGAFLFSRADVEALDLMGWNVNPNAHAYANGNKVDLLAPPNNQSVPASTSINFQWQSTPAPENGWALYIDLADTTDDDMPFRAYEDLTTPTFTIPISQALPPGTYKWEVTADLELGYQHSGNRFFTVLCPSDFNQDGFVNGDDFDGYVDAFTEGALSADFNGDGFVNGDDFDAFIDAFTSGC